MNRIRRTSTIAAAVVAAGAIAAGCGNGEQNDYVDEVNALQIELVEEVTSSVSGAPPTDPEAIADVAGGLQETFESKADELEAVDAPDEVADLHAQLVASVRDVGAQIGAASEGLSSGDPQQASQAAIQLQEAATGLQTELNGLIDQINAQLQG